MPSEGIDRRLAAILSADAVGYSRLMAEDEIATIRAIGEARAAIGGLVREHGGRVVDATGDNLLAEFPAALEAVRCALAIQDRTGNSGDADRRLRFRIGVHVGDVAAEGERIYGDGVNIAARLQAIAQPGELCISSAVYDLVRGRLPFAVEDLGVRGLKNLPRPVHVFRVRAMAGGEMRSPRRLGRILAAVFVAALAALLARQVLRDPAGLTPAGRENAASLVVLPFANMSEDPDQEHFADGFTEDLITDLSRFEGLFVIARNSAFTYKGRAVRVDEVGRELGVRYVVEGGVRRAGERVRITAQLVDAETGHQVWAERYDGELGDVFGVQDAVRSQIISALSVRLGPGDPVAPERLPTRSPEAYDAYLLGTAQIARYTRQDTARARASLERAIALDPEFAAPYSGLADVEFMEFVNRWSEDTQAMSRALGYAKRAVALDPRSAPPRVTLARVLLMIDRAQGIAEAERAVTLAPGDAGAQMVLGEALMLSGEAERGLPHLELAARLDPFSAWASFHLGRCYYLLGRYSEAVVALERATAAHPDEAGHRVFLAAAYAAVGRQADARAQVREVWRISPNFSASQLESWLSAMPFGETIIEHLRQAGLD